ncbi:hypothetical protein BH23BAC1_BH23BAC1_45280 [soil metagenome]
MNLQKKSIGILTIFAAALFSFIGPTTVDPPILTYNVDPSQSEII